MRSDLSDITVVLDRSGSMSSCKADAEGGLNTFIDEQKKLPGSAIFSLVQFDTDYEFVYKGTPIQNVLACALVPRGQTALLDAVGRAIVETGERLSKTPEGERPGLVCFVIITDGQENASREFRLSKIKEMIEHQQNIYKWKFTFLGAKQDAFAEAGAMGIPKNAIANFAEEKTSGGILAASKNVARMRSMVSNGLEADCSYTDEERVGMS